MYIVPKVPLIPQTLDGACWYASAQMVIQWRREITQSCEMGILDPSEDSVTVAKWKANNGIGDKFILTLVSNLGLEAIPPMSATAQAISDWLKYYGPLWINGSTHITVLAGIDVKKSQVFIHDPLPVNKGTKEWRSMDWLYGMGSARRFDSLDPQTNSGVFLHCPA